MFVVLDPLAMEACNAGSLVSLLFVVCDVLKPSVHAIITRSTTCRSKVLYEHNVGVFCWLYVAPLFMGLVGLVRLPFL